MNHRPLVGALALALSLALAPTSSAQCAGQGNLSLEVTLGASPGRLTMSFEGMPFMHVCVACDTDPGPVTLPGLATLCLGFSPSFAEVVFFLPPSGQATFSLPYAPVAGLEVCCVALGLDPSAPSSLAVSQTSCLPSAPCVSGGHREVGHSTSVATSGSGPWAVASSLGNNQGNTVGRTEVIYDPANPPSFPVTDDGIVYIEAIAQVNGELVVTSLCKSDVLVSRPAGRLPNESLFTVSVDGATNQARVHTSCSQPLTTGMVIGPFTITRLTPAKASAQ